MPKSLRESLTKEIDSIWLEMFKTVIKILFSYNNEPVTAILACESRVLPNTF